MIGLVGLAHGTSHFFHLMLPPLFPWLMQDFSLSYTDVGLLTSTFFLISGVGQALAGFAVDRVGPQRVLFFGVGGPGALGRGAGPGDELPDAVAECRRRRRGQQHLPSRGLHAPQPSGEPAASRARLLGARRVGQPGLGRGARLHGRADERGRLARCGLRRGGAVGAVVLTLLWLRRRHAGVRRGRHRRGARGDGEDRCVSRLFGFLSSLAVWLSFAFFLFTTMAFGILQNYSPAILEPGLRHLTRGRERRAHRVPARQRHGDARQAAFSPRAPTGSWRRRWPSPH